MSVIYSHPVLTATRAPPFADHACDLKKREFWEREIVLAWSAGTMFFVYTCSMNDGSGKLREVLVLRKTFLHINMSQKGVFFINSSPPICISQRLLYLARIFKSLRRCRPVFSPPFPLAELAHGHNALCCHWIATPSDEPFLFNWWYKLTCITPQCILQWLQTKWNK